MTARAMAPAPAGEEGTSLFGSPGRDDMTQTRTAAPAPTRLFYTLAAATACLVWAYWTTLTGVAGRWAHDPQYSHGYLVPVFALVLLGLRRAQVPTAWA